IPILRNRRIQVGVIKHAHHNFEMDREGKDSFRFRQAGATEVMLASSRRWVLHHENSEEADPDPGELLQRMNLDHLDLVLVEGFKHHMLPKIEIHRPSLGRDMMHPDLPGIIALASDETPSDNLDIPWLDLNHPEKFAEFIIEWMKT
ncbi:MAG: molybdopterin-guanine dinucleotide biosynthesis protein B, partial [SAR324 cluster bacterium]|nr:molybdopterin-guanine dinucleotide biosynthesis protein B [SAR324 cluster bacterium]